MNIVGLIDEDFINYKNPCMVIECPYCSFKCDKQFGQPICQNSLLASSSIINYSDDKIVDRYVSNDITKAICFQGLEPFDSFEEMLKLIDLFRSKTDDDIVIYTGYYSHEVLDKLKYLCKYDNIIIKYGRFIPGQPKHFDPVLGVNLSSDNQFGVKLTDFADIIDALIANEGYCPCALERNEDTKCCCKEFRDGFDIECHCGLYTKLI